MPGKIGIVREWKTECERRVPVTPTDLERLSSESGLVFTVEPSPNRVFSDSEYSQAGATVSSELDDCDFFIGIKEIPVERLRPGKPHLFFSHTIKGQSYNMPLLRRMLEMECTLLDFELVRDDADQRLIFFGRQAGQAGMLNSLWTVGQRLETLGLLSPFAELRQARHYDGLKEGMDELFKIRDRIAADGMPSEIGPFVCAITGTGNVSTGAQDVIAALDPITLTPEELLEGRAAEHPHRVHQVIYDEHHMYRRRDGGAFSVEEYRAHPDLYESAFADHLPHLSMIVTGHFWDIRYPRLVSKADIASLFAVGNPKLIAIGDVSCDPEGGIEVTLKATYPDNPCYVYHPENETCTDGFAGAGLAMMAVEILPTELAFDSSQVFSHALRDFLPDVLSADFTAEFEDLELPAAFKRAVIAHKGRLTPDWEHLLD